MTDSFLPAIPTSNGNGGLGSWLNDLPRQRPAVGYLDDSYKEEKKPPKDYIISTADALRSAHSLRLAVYKEWAEALDGDNPGYFAEDEEDIANDIMEVMPLNALREDYEFRCGFLSMHDPYPTLRGRDANDRDESMIVEDLVIADFADEEHQFYQEFHADFRWNEAAHLLRYGMLVGLDVLDPENRVSGLAMSLVDPQTIFPVAGGRAGWTEVYRVFEARNEEIVGAYGGRPGTSEYQRIENKVRRKATMIGTTRNKRLDYAETRPVIERWGRDYLQVIIDGTDLLLERKHGYRRLPFTIVICASDMPAGTMMGTNLDSGDYPTTYGPVHVSDASVDIARQMRPPGYRQLKYHKIAEAVAGRELSMFKWSKDPHKIVEYDPSLEWKLAEEVDLTPGETTNVPLPNKINLVTPVVDPLIATALQANIQANVGGGALTMMRQGAMPPQTSGSALNKLMNMGGAADTILVRTLRTFKRERARWRLELRQHFGGTMGEDEDHLGIIKVRARDGAKRAVHFVTPEILDRTGTDIDIDLHFWEPDVGRAQYIMTLRTPGPTGKPLFTDDTLRRAMRMVPDPDREGERIEDEHLRAMPPVLHQDTIARLEKLAEQADAEGDWESVDRLLTEVAELEFLHELAVASGEAAPPTPEGTGLGPGGSGIPTQQPAAPAPPQVQLPGQSLPELGIGVGTQGARPVGSTQAAVTPVTQTGGGGMR